MSRQIGILTGGGDAPGLNAVIRAVVKDAVGRRGWRIVGIEDSFNGLFCDPYRVQELTMVRCQGLLPRGGTLLGTTNKGDPFGDGIGQDRSPEVVRAMERLGLEGLIIIGGDGSLAIADRLITQRGVKVVAVPKTIDNDLAATDSTFGFQSAVACATDALDRLHTTAASHDRVIILEVMGRDAGWIALHAGIAGGADVVVIPEIPWSSERICGKIQERAAVGRRFSLIVVAEGARPEGEEIVPGKAAQRVADAIQERLPEVEVRITVLGHLQRGGSPVSVDRVLATRYGVGAVDLVAADRWGEMVTVTNGKLGGVPIREALAPHHVDPKGELVRVARAVGVEFGG